MSNLSSDLIVFNTFHHLLRQNILLFPRKIIGSSIVKIQIQNCVLKIKPQMIHICLFFKRRRKEVKEDPNLVANGGFRCLVAFGRFHCLVALGRFQCLVPNGRRNAFSQFPPKQILLKPIRNII